MIKRVLSWLGSMFSRAETKDAHRPPAKPAQAAPSQQQQDLPLEIKDAGVFALEADDHSVNVYSEAGLSVYYSTLKDAIDVLTDIDGVQTHRSWWVAINAIDRIERQDSRVQVLLKNGRAVPVSRTGLERLKALNLYSATDSPDESPLMNEQQENTHGTSG